jgi:hypothetical protein
MLAGLLTGLDYELTGGPANSGAVQVRAIKGVAENQKSESACGNTRVRRDFLACAQVYEDFKKQWLIGI